MNRHFKANWASQPMGMMVRVQSIVINPDPSVFVCVCLSVCLRAYLWNCWINVCRSPVAMARSSSGGFALCYVLPVLWMTSRLVVMGAMPKGGGWHCSAGGEWCGDTGAESDVYECLFIFALMSETNLAVCQLLILKACEVLLIVSYHIMCRRSHGSFPL